MESRGSLSQLKQALAACKGAEIMDQHLDFFAQPKDGKLLLELRNTSFGETAFRDGLSIYKKADRGTGTKSMVETVRKYGGMVEFSEQDTGFFTRIVFLLKQERWKAKGTIHAI